METVKMMSLQKEYEEQVRRTKEKELLLEKMLSENSPTSPPKKLKKKKKFQKKSPTMRGKKKKKGLSIKKPFNNLFLEEMIEPKTPPQSHRQKMQKDGIFQTPPDRKSTTLTRTRSDEKKSRTKKSPKKTLKTQSSPIPKNRKRVSPKKKQTKLIKNSYFSENHLNSPSRSFTSKKISPIKKKKKKSNSQIFSHIIVKSPKRRTYNDSLVFVSPQNVKKKVSKSQSTKTNTQESHDTEKDVFMSRERSLLKLSPTHNMKKFRKKNAEISENVSTALRFASPQNVYIMKDNQSVISKSDQYRNQVNLLLSRYNDLGPFLINLFTLVFREKQKKKSQKLGSTSDDDDEDDYLNKVAFMKSKEILKDPILRKLFLSTSEFEFVEKLRVYDALMRCFESSGMIQPNSHEFLFEVQILSNVMHVLSELSSVSVGLFKTMRPKIIITGPKKSGKTAILATFARNILDNYMNSSSGNNEQWLKTLFLVINFSDLIFPFEDITFFYVSYVSLIFDAITTQRVNIRPFRKSIERAFHNVIVKGPKKSKFSNSFVENFPQEHLMIGILCDRLKKFWDEKKFSKFMMSAVLLPKLIGEIFGFTQVLNIFDNFHCAYVKLTDNRSTSKKSTSFLSTYFKRAVLSRNQSYIITGNTKELFLSLKDSNNNTTGTGLRPINLLRESTVFDILDLIDVEMYYGVEDDYVDVNDKKNDENEDEEEGEGEKVKKSDENEKISFPAKISCIEADYYGGMGYGLDDEIEEKRRQKIINMESLRGCPGYLMNVLRYVRLNKIIVRKSNTVPIPKVVVNEMLSNIKNYVKIMAKENTKMKIIH